MGKSKGGSGRPNVPPGGGQIKIHFKKHEVLYLVILTTLFIFLNGIKLFPPKTSLSLLQNNDIIKTLDWLTNEKGYLLTLTNLQDNLNKNGFLQLGKRKLKELIYEMEKIENSISPSDLESLKKYVKDYLTEKLIDQSLKNKK